MAETRLEQLKKRSASALQHPDLVRLARQYSPSKTFTEAQRLGWPKRQAESARSLAQLRRDYSTEFDGLFSTATVEREPRGLQAQDNRRKPRMLDRIKKPDARLRYMLRHELLEELADELNTLAGTLTPYFWSGRQRDIGGNCVLLQRKSTSGEDPLETIFLAFYPTDKADGSEQLNINDAVVNLHWSTLVELLGWNHQQARSFAQKVLNSLVEKPVEDYGRIFIWVVDAMKAVSRHYIGADNEGRPTERWLLRWYFQKGELSYIRRNCLPDTAAYREARVELGIGEKRPEREELNPIVDRFLELGLSMEEVRKEFLAWLEKNLGRFNPSFYIMVAGAKCFEDDDPDRARLMRGHLPKFWEQYMTRDIAHPDSDWWETFGQLGRCGMWEHRTHVSWQDHTPVDNDRERIRGWLVEALSHGRARFVYDFLWSWGGVLDLRKHSSAIACGNHDRKETLESVEALAAEAFWLAFKEERYGVATALSQQYDVLDDSQRDRLQNKALDVVRERALGLLGYEHLDDEDLIGCLADGVHDDESCDPEHCDDAHLEIHRGLLELNGEWQAQCSTLVDEAQAQLDGVVEMAVAHEQPIRLQFAY